MNYRMYVSGRNASLGEDTNDDVMMVEQCTMDTQLHEGMAIQRDKEPLDDINIGTVAPER